MGVSVFKTHLENPLKNDYLERRQLPFDPRRAKVIELFVAKAGDKLADLTDLAEELETNSGCMFERALADALDIYKIK